jgi:hypothetical protein
MYQIRTDEEAQATLDALSVDVLERYIGVLDVLELTPWNGTPLNKTNPDGAMRTMTLGPRDNGLITYLVVEDVQRVDVISVCWAG